MARRLQLTPDTVRRIRARRREGAGYRVLAGEFGLSQGSIGNALRGAAPAELVAPPPELDDRLALVAALTGLARVLRVALAGVELVAATLDSHAAHGPVPPRQGGASEPDAPEGSATP